MPEPSKSPAVEPEAASGDGSLLDRLERQAEALGVLKERVHALEAALKRERASREKVKKLLEQERERQSKAAERATLLEERINSIHDTNEELARERRTVSTLQGELRRAWYEVNTLQEELEAKRRTPLSSKFRR